MEITVRVIIDLSESLRGFALALLSGRGAAPETAAAVTPTEAPAEIPETVPAQAPAAGLPCRTGVPPPDRMRRSACRDCHAKTAVRTQGSRSVQCDLQCSPFSHLVQFLWKNIFAPWTGYEQEKGRSVCSGQSRYGLWVEGCAARLAGFSIFRITA